MHYENRYMHYYRIYLFLQTNKYMQIRNIGLHGLMNKIGYVSSLYSHVTEYICFSLIFLSFSTSFLKEKIYIS
jgi:hypothetical protein